jgi:hypothetical protein
LDNALVVVNAQGNSINNAFSVVVNGRRRGLMQSLVEFLVLFPAKFSTPEIQVKFLIHRNPHPNFSLKFRPLRPLAPKISNRPHAHALSASSRQRFRTPPEGSRTLINSSFGGGAAEESIINAFSVVVNAKALAFSFNSALLSSKNQ